MAGKKGKKDKAAKYGVYVASATQKTARKLERAVLKVLGTNAGDEVKKEALRVLAQALATNISIANTSISV